MNKTTKPRHLRFDYYGAYRKGDHRHAQEAMRDLGIEYEHSTPQSIADQYWFWNCTNIPRKLPSYITTLKVEPEEAIGHGLSQDIADYLNRNNTKK